MERELVKQLGAMWDPARKKWFVLPGFELEPFKRWLQPDKSAGRARTALIATVSIQRVKIALMLQYIMKCQPHFCENI